MDNPTLKNMKRCVVCRELVPLSDFNVRRRSRDGIQNVCRACNRARARRYYAENREAHLRAVRARMVASRAAAWLALGDYLIEHPCVDCGEGDIRVLDFDHRPGAGKSADVMRLVQDGHSLARVMSEVAKCDVRCRNCHARITYERIGGTWRSRYLSERSAGSPDVELAH